MTLFAPKLTIFKNLYIFFEILIFQFNIKQGPFKFKLNYKWYFLQDTVKIGTPSDFQKFAQQITVLLAWNKMGMLLQSALNLVPKVRFYSKFPNVFLI